MSVICVSMRWRDAPKSQAGVALRRADLCDHWRGNDRRPRGSSHRSRRMGNGGNDVRSHRGEIAMTSDQELLHLYQRGRQSGFSDGEIETLLMVGDWVEFEEQQRLTAQSNHRDRTVFSNTETAIEGALR